MRLRIIIINLTLFWITLLACSGVEVIQQEPPPPVDIQWPEKPRIVGVSPEDEDAFFCLTRGELVDLVEWLERLEINNPQRSQ